jgi:hypothetical protein
MAGRDDFKVSRGKHKASGEALAAGKKLQDYLLRQRELGGALTQGAQVTLSDGTLVRARYAKNVPIIEYFPPTKKGGTETNPTVVQGFVANPRTVASAVAYGAASEVILDNEKAATPAHAVSYINLLFNSTYDPATALLLENNPVAGYYEKNRRDKDLFRDGLKNHGNVDWRNKDESMVVSWGGPMNRYFGSLTSTSLGTLTTLGKKACINGDIIVDFTSLPGILTQEVVTGCCVRDGHLIAALALPFVSGTAPRIRLLRAPLVRRASTETRDHGWFAQAEFKLSPRFELVPVDAWVEIFRHTFPSNDQPGITRNFLAFNQSATEARQMLMYAVDRSESFGKYNVREIVIDLEDIDAISATVTAHPESLFYDSASSHGPTTVQFAAPYVRNMTYYGPSPGPEGIFDVDYWNWNAGESDANTARAWLVDHTYTSSQTPQSTWIPWAVDYRNDVPEYIYVQPRSITANGTWASVRTQNCTIPYAEGRLNTGTGLIDFSIRSDVTTCGLKLPWQFNIIDGLPDAPEDSMVLTTGYIENVHTEATATLSLNGSSAVIPSLAYTMAGTQDQPGRDRRLVMFHCDLRTRTIIYGIHEIDTDRVVSMVGSKQGSDSAPVKRVVTTGSVTTTHRLRTIVHVNGVDVEDSGYVHINTFVSSVNTTDNVNSATGDAWVYWAWFPASAYVAPDLGTTYGNLGAGLTDNTLAQTWRDSIGRGPGTAIATGTDNLVPTYLNGYTHPMPSASNSAAGTASVLVEGPFTPSLYGNFSLMTWANVSLAMYTGATSSMVCGYCCSDKDGNYCFSMPWPGSGGAQGWKNGINGERTLDSLTGANSATIHYPIWLTTKFVYEV